MPAPITIISLMDTPRELADAGFRAPSYSQLWAAAVGMKIPAHKVGSRWMIRADDLEVIAHALDL